MLEKSGYVVLNIYIFSATIVLYIYSIYTENIQGSVKNVMKKTLIIKTA